MSGWMDWWMDKPNMYLSTYLFIYPSFYLSIYLSINALFHVKPVAKQPRLEDALMGSSTFSLVTKWVLKA